MRFAKVFAIAFILATFFAQVSLAQDYDDLRSSLEGVFTEVLDLNLSGPGAHGDHFKSTSVDASARIIEGLGNFISTSAASFPQSSTTAGVTFDFSGGAPVARTTSAGPIFAENATTTGKGAFTFGGTFSYLNLAKLRGVRTQDLVFAFTHQDVGEIGLGDSENERDYITLEMDLDLAATVAAFQASFGLTDRIDLGIAIPFVSVKMSGDPLARINSYTFASTGSANHYFEGGTATEPVLSIRPTPLDESASGIGDISLRGKMHVYEGARGDIGFLVETRLPTGDEKNFLGSGEVSVKGMFITSGQWGGINPHLNLAYDYRKSEFERDQVELTWGFDQKATDALTIVVEWSGEFDLGEKVEGLQFPGLTPIYATDENNNRYAAQYVTPSNIPNRPNDNILNSSLGLKYTPSPKITLIGNVIFPLNDGGLRSSWIPTVGFSYSL